MDNTKKNFIWNMVGATVNSFTSFFFLIIVTRLNGTNIAGIFTFGFSIACLFQVISNYAGRTYQVTNIDESIKDSDFVYNRITSCLIMLVVVAVYLFIKGYDIFKNAVILLFVLYRLIESFTDVMYGVIQKNDQLYKVGISLFLRGIVGTASFLVADFLFKSVIISIACLLFVSLVVSVFYDYRNFRFFYKRNKYSASNNINLFKLGIFVFGFTFLTQYVLNAPKYAIDDYATNEMQTIYGIVSMPATFILLCSQFIIQPFIVRFSELIKTDKYRDLLRLSSKMAAAIAAIGVLGVAAAYLFGIPIFELVYKVNLKNHLAALLVVIVGATLFSISFMLSNVLTAMRKTFIQIVFYMLCSVIIMFLSKYMVIRHGVLGGTVSYALTMFILCALYVGYFLILIRRCTKNA